MTPPVGGERHERAVEAAVAAMHRRVMGLPEAEGEFYEVAQRAAIDAYLAELERQGVRLVEQPKCPKCGGDGRFRTRAGCPRCGGSGFEPLVPLREIVAWLRSHHHPYPDDPVVAVLRAAADALQQHFGGGER